VCQKIQTAEKRGNVSFRKAQLIVCLIRKRKRKKKRRMMMDKKRVEGSLIAHFSIKYLLVVFAISIFFSSTYLGIFCGWMPEFEDKAIKWLRNAEPTTITPTLML